MEDLRIKEEEKKKRSSRFKINLYAFIKKRKWWILSFLLLATIIFFPEECGNFVGNWIDLFLTGINK